MPNQTDQTLRTLVRGSLDNETYTQFKILSARRGRNRADLVEEAIVKLIAAYDDASKGGA
jgi:predicted DNA-binding protein